MFRAAVEGVQHVISGECRVRSQNTNLQILKFVRLKLAVLQCDQKRIQSLNVLVDLNEVLCEETANRREVAFSHGGPKILFQLDDVDWSRGLCRRGLSKRTRSKK